jgi:hypothetical protein
MKGGCAVTGFAADNNVTATDAPSKVRATIDRIEFAQPKIARGRRQREKTDSDNRRRRTRASPSYRWTSSDSFAAVTTPVMGYGVYPNDEMANDRRSDAPGKRRFATTRAIATWESDLQQSTSAVFSRDRNSENSLPTSWTGGRQPGRLSEYAGSPIN